MYCISRKRFKLLEIGRRRKKDEENVSVSYIYAVYILFCLFFKCIYRQFWSRNRSLCYVQYRLYCCGSLRAAGGGTIETCLGQYTRIAFLLLLLLSLVCVNMTEIGAWREREEEKKWENRCQLAIYGCSIYVGNERNGTTTKRPALKENFFIRQTNFWFELVLFFLNFNCYYGLGVSVRYFSLKRNKDNLVHAPEFVIIACCRLLVYIKCVFL